MLSEPLATPVIVTGGADGIGRRTAAALLAEGRPVAIWDRNGDGAVQVARALAAEIADRGAAVPQVAAFAVDVTDPEAVEGALARSRERFGTIGGLVHSAGIGVKARLGEIDFAAWGRVLDVNVTAFARLVQLVMPDLTAQSGAAVVAVASTSTFFGLGGLPEYAASKHALLGLVRSFAGTLGPAGVRINAVAPGLVRTNLNEGRGDAAFDRVAASTPLRRVGSPEDIASAIAFLISQAASWITGTCLTIDGGITALLPARNDSDVAT